MLWTRNKLKKAMPVETIEALESNLNNHEMTVLTRLGTKVDVAAGDTLTEEGTIGREALILVRGTASVLRNGQHIATVSPGEMIGEIALLTGEMRTATVVADTDATVYALSQRDFETLLARCPRLANRVTRDAVYRMTAA